MPKPDTLILNDGGLKSLVATAAAGRAAPPMLLYIHDGRPSDAAHHAMFLKQAEHFKAGKRIELSMPHLMHGEGESLQVTPLARYQYLTAAVGQAVRLGARRLVWPVRVGDAFEAISQIAETLVLLEQTAENESGTDLRIETPLLDMAPVQVIELGEQLKVPWRFSRTCIASAREACGRCGPCKQRAEAFDQCRLPDPLLADEGESRRDVAGSRRGE